MSSSPRSSHDSCDIAVVQSTVCNSSKLKITFIKCLVTQDPGACWRRGARACGIVRGDERAGPGTDAGKCVCRVHQPRLPLQGGCGIYFPTWGSGNGAAGGLKPCVGKLEALLGCSLRKAEWEGPPPAKDPAPSSILSGVGVGGGGQGPAGGHPGRVLPSQVPFLPTRWSLTPERICFAFEAEQIAPNGTCFQSDFPEEKSRASDTPLPLCSIHHSVEAACAHPSGC